MVRLPMPIVSIALTSLLAALPARATSANFDFENLPLATETPFQVSNDGVTAQFSGPSSVDPGAFGISTNFPSPTGFQYRLMSGDFLTVGSAFGAIGAALTITFSTAINAFSVNFALDDQARASTLSFATGAGGSGSSMGATSPGFLYPEGTLTFTGAPFTAITFRSTAIDFQLDNLAVTAAVPEPSTLAMLAAGLGVLGLFGRRSRRANSAAC